MTRAEDNAFEFRDRYWQEAGAGTDIDALLYPLDSTLRTLPPANISSQQKVAWSAGHLHEIGDGLAIAGLPGAFNHTYGSLTQTIAENFSDYHSPDTLGDAVVNFKGRYTAPLLSMTKFLKGEDAALYTMRQSWIQSMLHSKLLDPDAPGAIQTSMGIGSHIIVDLAPTVVFVDPPEGYKEDYMTVVARHIAETIEQLAPELMPGHHSLRSMMIPIMNRMIHVGRLNAWRDYEKVKLLNSESQELLYSYRDRQASRLGLFYLTAGRSALALAHATEHFSFSHRSDAPVDDDRAA